jgi:hypothetical protein
MDALLDISLAFDEFFSLQRAPSHFEALGFFQALVTVQDAVREFRQALELSAYKSESLDKIRDLRNRIVAHPVYSSDSIPPSSCMIDSESFTKSGFACVLYYSDVDKPAQTVSICYPKMSMENFSELLPAWDEVLTKMMELNGQFQKKYIDRNAESKIRNLNYHFSKFCFYSESELSSVCIANILVAKKILGELHQGALKDGISRERSEMFLDLIRNLDDYEKFVFSDSFEPRTKVLLYDGLVAQKDSLVTSFEFILANESDMFSIPKEAKC